MKTEKTALVLGATGLVGKNLVHKLLQDDRYRSIESLGRRTLGINHPKLHEFQFELEDLADTEKKFAVNDVFCCLGSTMKKAGSREAFERFDRHYVVNAALCAKRAGAQRFIYVSAVAGEINSLSYHLRVKGWLEKDITDLGLPFSRAVRPSLLLGNREHFRLGESFGGLIYRPLSLLLHGSLKKYRTITGEEVAQAMINVANDLPAHDYLEVRPT